MIMVKMMMMVIITIVNPSCNMIKVMINMILLMMMKFMTLMWTNSLVYLLPDRVPLLKDWNDKKPKLIFNIGI